MLVFSSLFVQELIQIYKKKETSNLEPTTAGACLKDTNWSGQQKFWTDISKLNSHNLLLGKEFNIIIKSALSLFVLGDEMPFFLLQCCDVYNITAIISGGSPVTYGVSFLFLCFIFSVTFVIPCTVKVLFFYRSISIGYKFHTLLPLYQKLLNEKSEKNTQEVDEKVVCFGPPPFTNYLYLFSQSDRSESFTYTLIFLEDDALLEEETEELSKITLENKDIQLDINIRGEELFTVLVNDFLL
ncbi:hypothetical protein ACJX0J_031779 [Zea mays]